MASGDVWESENNLSERDKDSKRTYYAEATNKEAVAINANTDELEDLIKALNAKVDTLNGKVDTLNSTVSSSSQGTTSAVNSASSAIVNAINALPH